MTMEGEDNRFDWDVDSLQPDEIPLEDDDNPVGWDHEPEEVSTVCRHPDCDQRPVCFGARLCQQHHNETLEFWGNPPVDQDTFNQWQRDFPFPDGTEEV
jgi:hypothetical protein